MVLNARYLARPPRSHMSLTRKISCFGYGRGNLYVVEICLTGCRFQKYMMRKSIASIDSYPNHRIIWHNLAIVSKPGDVAGQLGSPAASRQTMRILRGSDDGGSFHNLPQRAPWNNSWGDTSG
uniref:Uncharacterized protein n=1 Tax=Arundo donax TaxID=35708 RepID=A0A0A9G601_ARUDO